MTILLSLANVLGAGKSPQETRRPAGFPPSSYQELAVESMRKLPAPKPSRISLAYSQTTEAVRRNVETDGREIVQWMQEAFTSNVLSAYSVESYTKAGGRAESIAGDGYVPGVVLGDSFYVSEPASSLAQRGYAYAYVGDTAYTVPLQQRVHVDFRYWFLVRKLYDKQWEGLIARYQDIINLPFEGELPLSNLDLNGVPVTFPIPVFSYRRRLAVPFVLVKLYYPEPSRVTIYFTDGSRWLSASLPEPDGPGTYLYRVRASSIPLTGYVLVTNDGAERPVTLLAITQSIFHVIRER